MPEPVSSVSGPVAAADAPRVDIGHLLDFGTWSLLQKAVVLLSALAIIFDRMDIQMMGFAIPAMAKAWAVSKASFAPILAFGLAGVSLGSVAGGFAGDALGRRKALVYSVIVFALGTWSIAFIHSLGALLVLRSVAGLGIGAALPNATTLCAEFTPANRRPMAVTLAVVCIPLGGLCAGLISAQVLQHGNWRALFWVGGFAPLMLAGLLALLLPESPRFMAARPNRHHDLVGLLRRMEKNVSGDAVFIEPQAPRGERPGIRNALFGPGQRRKTLALWKAFFLSLVSIYLVFNWLPSVLTAHGLSIKAASQGLAAYDFGGIFGALLFAWWVSRSGSRIPLLAGAAGGIVTALGLRFLPLGSGVSMALLFSALAAQGLFVNAVQTNMFALAAHLYATPVRATGVAAALATGRTGAILSALLGSIVLNLGSKVYFTILAVSMAGVAVALMVLKEHIEGVSTSDLGL